MAGETGAVEGAAGPALVRLADQDVPLEQLRTHPERYHALFTRARAEVKHAICLCRPHQPKNPIKLVIRNRSGRFHLASWPDQGHHHAPRCFFFRPDPALSGSSAYTDAILHTDDGVAIRSSTPLQTRVTPAGPARPMAPAAEREPGESRHSLGLLALLHYLWERAGLSVWQRERRRTWASCHEQLVQHIGSCVINGLDLNDVLYVVPPFRRDTADRNAAAWDAFLGRLGRAGKHHRRGLVLGQIRVIEPSQFSIGVRLAHLRKPLYVKETLLERAHRSHRAAFSDAAGPGGLQNALFLVDRSPRGHAVVEDLAVMLTNSAWIPADSSHEVQMADALIAAGRTFLKPLRFDRTKSVFPDFVLLDTVPQTCVEVWGIHGRDDYEQRKRAKQTYYRSRGFPLLEWDVREPRPDVQLG